MHIRFAAVVSLTALASTTEASESPIDALMGAIEKADVETVASMLDDTPDLVHQTDWRESLPLHTAAFKSTPATVGLLLDCGARVNAPAKGDGRSALSWAALSCKKANAAVSFAAAPTSISRGTGAGRRCTGPRATAARRSSTISSPCTRTSRRDRRAE